jgi:hypothetical protein
MEIILKIILQVNPNEDGKEYPISALEDTAREAIDEALNHASNRGFNHFLAHEVSIGVNSVEIVPQGGQYILSNRRYPNDSTELVADNWADAVIEALEEIGWNVYLDENDDENDENEDYPEDDD